MLSSYFEIGLTARVKVFDFKDEARQNAEVWTFIYREKEHKLILDSFSIIKKETPRHKYRVIGFWNRLDQRKNTVEKRTPPKDVAFAAREQFCEVVSVEGES